MHKANPEPLSKSISNISGAATAALRWPVERGEDPAHQRSSSAESIWKPVCLILTRVPVAVVARDGSKAGKAFGFGVLRFGKFVSVKMKSNPLAK